LDEASSWAPARIYSRAYLHHLVKAEEILGMMLITGINLAYYQALMAGLRLAISQGRLNDFIAETKLGWEQGDLPVL
jgi:queuine tRNA-ribosyltransferase